MTSNHGFSGINSVEELPLSLSVPDVATVLNIGRSSAYDLVRCGRLRSIKIGRNIRVPRSAIVDFLDN